MRWLFLLIALPCWAGLPFNYSAVTDSSYAEIKSNPFPNDNTGTVVCIFSRVADDGAGTEIIAGLSDTATATSFLTFLRFTGSIDSLTVSSRNAAGATNTLHSQTQIVAGNRYCAAVGTNAAGNAWVMYIGLAGCRVRQESLRVAAGSNAGDWITDFQAGAAPLDNFIIGAARRAVVSSMARANVDAFYYFSRVLTIEEINQISGSWGVPQTGFWSTTAGWRGWVFDGPINKMTGETTTILDLSGNGKHLTMACGSSRTRAAFPSWAGVPMLLPPGGDQ